MGTAKHIQPRSLLALLNLERCLTQCVDYQEAERFESLVISRVPNLYKVKVLS